MFAFSLDANPERRDFVIIVIGNHVIIITGSIEQ
jgi:hypothetical protein